MFFSAESPIRSIIILIGTGALVMIAFLGWRDLYTQYLERVKPTFEVLESPRGISTNPVKVRVVTRDGESGLSEIDISLVQGQKVTPVLQPMELDGVAEQEINLTISPSSAPLLPGKAKIIINATDSSLWGMAGTLELDTMVDYAKPTLELVSAPDAIALGDAQLVFYRVSDEDLSESGIIIGEKAILGFPARLLDPVFNQDNFYVVPFVIPIDAGTSEEIKLFAEDRSGNAVSIPLNTIQVAMTKNTQITSLSENSLRNLTSRVSGQNLSKLERYFKLSGDTLPSPERIDGDFYLLHLFSLFNDKLREINQLSLVGATTTFRSERFWDAPLIASGSAGNISFGSEVSYKYKDQEIGKYRELFSQRIVKSNDQGVVSAAKGIVLFVENFAAYGRTVAIDHGLGLVTLYSGLNEVIVRAGESVEGARNIGSATLNQDTNSAEFFFAVRISGIPVNPTQWTNREQFRDKISRPINAVKRKLGLPVEIE